MTQGDKTRIHLRVFKKYYFKILLRFSKKTKVFLISTIQNTTLSTQVVILTKKSGTPLHRSSPTTTSNKGRHMFNNHKVVSNRLSYATTSEASILACAKALFI